VAFISVVHPEVSVFVPVLIVPAVFSVRSIEIIRGEILLLLITLIQFYRVTPHLLFTN
jgi:hypothetical protein